MAFYLSIVFFLIFTLLLTWIFFHICTSKIKKLEEKIIDLFCSRTDTFPSLYEVTQNKISRHTEIFTEILELRKQEFSLSNISHEIESFLELESKIHHEINFIFQVCNKNPKLINDGDFLYVRDIIMKKSTSISQEIKKYRKIITIYNRFITYKNYSWIWLIVPFYKKSSI